MNWDAFGAVGEWVGGLATIGTLFYLAYQVRQNTRSSRSAAYQAASSAISAWTNQLAVDTQLTQNLTKGLLYPDDLEDEFRVQVGMQLNSLFRNYENIFYQWREKAIGDDVWEGWSVQVRSVFWSPGVQRWWPSWRNHCHAEFRMFLESSDVVKGNISVEIPRAET